MGEKIEALTTVLGQLTEAVGCLNSTYQKLVTVTTALNKNVDTMLTRKLEETTKSATVLKKSGEFELHVLFLSFPLIC